MVKIVGDTAQCRNGILPFCMIVKFISSQFTVFLLGGRCSELAAENGALCCMGRDCKIKTEAENVY